jgi:leucine dehydrogenase
MKKQKLSKKVDNKLLKTLPEFDNHFLVVNLHDKKAKLDSYIAIHKKNGLLPSFGATRILEYSTKKDAIRDALKLARLMSYKSAMANLPYGGAKAVIIKPKGKFSREKLFEAYARGLNELEGKFVTGTDVGLCVSDLKYMKKYTKYLVGYLANPEKATALGVVKSLDVALDYVYKNNDYSKHSFAIQGVGKVGFEILKILINGGAKNIYIADIDKNRIKEIVNMYPFIKVVDINIIHKQNVDVYSPCALSGVLNKETMKELKCKIIVGSANNQLENISICEELYKKGIVYCPDYVVNSGGLISVINEYKHGKLEEAKLSRDIDRIPKVLKRILLNSDKKSLSPLIVSDAIGLSIIKNNSLK